MDSRTVFRNTLIVLATAAAAYILLIGIRVWIVLLIAIIIASAVRPLVVRLNRWRIPSGLAILFVYGGIALSLVILVLVVVPPVITQMANYLEEEDRLANRIVFTQLWIERRAAEFTGNPDFAIADQDQTRAAVDDLVREVRTAAPNFLSSISGTLGEAALVFIMGVYWLTSYNGAIQFISELFTVVNRERVRELIFEIENALGSYMRGVTAVALIVGIANFIPTMLLGVQNAGTYAFIIAVGTLLPVVGALIGGIIAVFLALLTSPTQAIIVLVVFLIVQQLESTVLTPRVMSRTMRIDPLLVMVAIFTGFAMAGPIGAIISVPIIGTISILLRRLVLEPRRESVKHKVEAGAVLLNLGTEAAVISVPSETPASGASSAPPTSPSGIITSSR